MPRDWADELLFVDRIVVAPHGCLPAGKRFDVGALGFLLLECGQGRDFFGHRFRQVARFRAICLHIKKLPSTRQAADEFPVTLADRFVSLMFPYIRCFGTGISLQHGNQTPAFLGQDAIALIVGRIGSLRELEERRHQVYDMALLAGDGRFDA